MGTAGEQDQGGAEDPLGQAAGPEDAARIEEVLAHDGLYVGTTVGVSMWPMLRNRRDTIIVEPVAGRLRVHDVPLYRRGGSYVLHRVVRVNEGSYDILGDNCLNVERNVPEDQVIGVLTGFYRGERRIDMEGRGYRAYVALWCKLYPVRRAGMRARALAGRVKRRLLRALRGQGSR